ncbi:MAG: hypothetical protein QG650_1071, partial [Patescibacteria group bacterium]|nr:hypothetical protein [Patescibacteria group bacterium]
MSYETRNTVAKITVVLWIVGLVAMALSIAKSSVALDPNAFFGLPNNERLP